MSGRLTSKQRRFIDAYMGAAAGNGTGAARVAGYRGTDAVLASIASENLRKPEIRDAIEALTNNDPAVATRIQRQRFWSQVMGDPNTDIRARLRASELLARTQGDFAPPAETVAGVLTYGELVLMAERAGADRLEAVGSEDL